MEKTRGKVDLRIIIAACITFIAFLIEVPMMRSGYCLALIGVDAMYFLVSFIMFAAFFVCLLTAIRPVINAKNVLISLASTALFMIIHSVILKLADSVLVAVTVEVVSPLIAVALLILTFLLCTKCRIRFNKKIVGIGVALFAAGTAANIISGLLTDYAAFPLLGMDMSDWGKMLTRSGIGEELNSLAVACSYALMFLTALLLIKTADDADLKPQKKVKADDAAEDEPPAETPEGTWRCMGCGEHVPQDRDHCECGYKRP